MNTSKLEKALITLNSRQLPGALLSHIGEVDSRAILVVTIIFLLLLLSVPIHNIEKTIWFAAYPIITAPLAHVSYSRVFRNSLVLLPFLIIIGIFNPFFERHALFTVFGIEISAGWISFLNLLLRGLLAMQAVLLLIRITGFINLCDAMHRIGMPTILSNQLFMLYRYLGVLMEEAITMMNARKARCYGRKHMPLRLWSWFIGTLLLRTIDRAKRINQAMSARGFNGTLFIGTHVHWNYGDTVYCFVWISVLLFLRFADLSHIILQITDNR